MFLLQHERRKETDHNVLRGVDEHALLDGGIDKGARWNFEFERLDHAASTYFGHYVEVDARAVQFVVQVRADFLDVLQHAFLFDDAQVFQRDATGQRSTAERRTMLAGTDGRCESSAGQERAERQSGGQWLRDGYDVGCDARVLIGEHAAGTS